MNLSKYKETERRFMVGVIWQGINEKLELKVITSLELHVKLKCVTSNEIYVIPKVHLDKVFICPSEEVYWPECSNKDCICGNVLVKKGSNDLNTIWKRCEVCNDHS